MPNPLRPDLRKKLRSPEYRRAFVKSQIQVGIPFQIRSMMKIRNWTQADLAQHAGMNQGVISRVTNTGYTANVKTLLRIAQAFDCALAVRFVPFSELADWSEHFSPETFLVPSFEEERKKRRKLSP